MFKRKPNEHIVALPEETMIALNRLDSDAQAILEMLSEFALSLQDLRKRINGAVIESVAMTEDELAAIVMADEVIGVETLADEIEEPLPKQKPKPGMPTPPPEAMATESSYGTSVSDEDRIRTSPFTRAPRSTQVEWLLSIMVDGDWHSSTVIGRKYANDERHYRYLRGALSGRLREMHEEGLVERRDSHVRGAMYEYRLRPGFRPAVSDEGKKEVRDE